MKRFWIPVAVLVLITSCAVLAESNFLITDADMNAIFPDIEKLYVDLHEHPELSGKEIRTAAKLAEGLRARV